MPAIDFIAWSAGDRRAASHGLEKLFRELRRRSRGHAYREYQGRANLADLADETLHDVLIEIDRVCTTPPGWHLNEDALLRHTEE